MSLDVYRPVVSPKDTEKKPQQTSNFNCTVG